MMPAGGRADRACVVRRAGPGRRGARPDGGRVRHHARLAEPAHLLRPRPARVPGRPYPGWRPGVALPALYARFPCTWTWRCRHRTCATSRWSRRTTCSSCR
ncbi:hypothetical protein LV779_07235 [Streptomyces thinghirensis]|nr:hypothetical protein [Streptomyces thinghirensis]